MFLPCIISVIMLNLNLLIVICWANSVVSVVLQELKCCAQMINIIVIILAT